MFKPDNIFSLLGTIVIVALATTLVLPGRQTTGVINAASNGFAKNLNTAIGRG